jgi:hypothetical protein
MQLCKNAVIPICSRSSTPRQKTGACELFPVLGEAVTSPDLTRLSTSTQSGYNQPGRSYDRSEYTGTCGCEASLQLYGQELNNQTGFEVVLLAHKPLTILVEATITSEG